MFKRIQRVRDTLGLTQEQMADRLGVSLRSQQNYESGKRVPDAEYMARLASLGADVLYVLDAPRAEYSVNEPAPAYGSLSREELALLDNYRHCSPEGRAIIRAGAAAAQREAAELKKPAKKKTA